VPAKVSVSMEILFRNIKANTFSLLMLSVLMLFAQLIDGITEVRINTRKKAITI